jgi:1,4-dihydroxy-2-naphthoate octaprenyltransferase
MATARTWIAGARPRTLPAAIVPVALGAASALGLVLTGASVLDADTVGAGPLGAADGETADVVWWRVAAALVVSLALQVGVNYANDYSDGVRGTDDVRVGPTRLVASGLAAPGSVKRAALASFGVAAVAGLAIALDTSLWLLVVGAAAIAAGWFYTGGSNPYGYLGLGEVFVFVFFGLVATVGTTYAAVERITVLSVVMGVVAGCLACALLVVNNLRDIPTDREVGKRTLAVRLGDRRTRTLYLVLVVVAFDGVLVAALWRPATLIALVAIPVAIAPVRAVRSGASGRDLVAVLGATGRLQLTVGLWAGIGLVIGA